MNNERFWSIIEESRRGIGPEDLIGIELGIQERLQRLPGEEIEAFADIVLSYQLSLGKTQQGETLRRALRARGIRLSGHGEYYPWLVDGLLLFGEQR
jgi:hypothetical protein